MSGAFNLNAAVATALANAAENGFTFVGMTAEEIAFDLISFDADIEASGASDDEVAAAVRAAQKIAQSDTEKSNG